MYTLYQRDGTRVILCQDHLDEVVQTEEEAIGKVEIRRGQEPCCMCEDVRRKAEKNQKNSRNPLRFSEGNV